MLCTVIMDLDKLKIILSEFDFKKAEELIKDALKSGADPEEIAKIFLK